MENFNSSNFKQPLAGDFTISLAEQLLGIISDPICVLNPAEAIVFVNQAMLDFTCHGESVIGRYFSDLPLEEKLAAELKHRANYAFQTGQVTECVVNHNSKLKNDKVLLSFTWTPYPAEDGSIAMVLGVGRIGEMDKQANHLLETKERQSILLRLSDALRSLRDTKAIQQEATRLLGEYLHVDRTYYASCDESRQLAFIEQDYVRNGATSLVGIHHYADFEAIVRTIRTGEAFIADDVAGMPEVQPQLARYLGNQMRALLAMPLMKEGVMVACLAVTSSVCRRWSTAEISLIEEAAERTWEAVERGRYETALKRNEQLMSKIFESLPVGVGLIENDGRVTLSNRELSRYLPEKIMPSVAEHIASRWKAWDAQGNLIEPSQYPGVLASRGESVLPGLEMLYTPEDGEQVWTQVAAVPVVDLSTEFRGLITVITNIDQIKRTTKALHEIEQQFRAFVATSSELVYRMSADWQLMYNLTGNGFLRETPEPIYNWLASYIPEGDQYRVKEAITHAIKEKSIFKLEHRVNQANGAIGWVISTAIPLLDKQGNITEWLGAADDITQRKTAEQQLLDFTSQLEEQVSARTQELQKSRDQLQSILDTSLIQISILQAVRDEDGKVNDIEIMLANKQHERVMGRTDLVGLHYVKEYPGMKKSVLFDLIVKTIETGEPQETEYYYPYENFNRWYASMFVKLNDGVVAFTMDISERKNAEEERFKNYLLLRQSEEMALLGSWDFDRMTGVFSWSDGMYRLFDMKERVEVYPEIYLQYTTFRGRSAAERVVSHIRHGDSEFSETLEINIGGRVKMFQLKATVIRNELGRPVRVLGVDMDATATKAAEEKIRQMEAQQQELIFRTTLASQEEQRRRISESLHNGLGQLLFGIKISLANVTEQQAVNQPENFVKDRIYTDQLLDAAITESRRISHELMPMILEDFGLKSAINDICQQLSSGVKFSCQITGFDSRLEKYIELAVFRIIQELMLNVAKHSGATRATAEASLNGKDIEIIVQDNGRGMLTDRHIKLGIGLSSIRSRIKLLNGEVKIESSQGGGTKVWVSMPLPS